MKTVLCFIAALGLLARADADPNRYPWRSFGAVNVDLQPLFAWWTFASETTNSPLDLTQMDSAKLAAVSNLWERLPARPLPDWFKISGRENQITIVGSRWRVDAVVAPAPMMLKHQVIYLEDPPVKEIEDFKLARSAYNTLLNAQGDEANSEQLMESNLQVEAAAMLVRTNVAVVPPAAVSQGLAMQRDLILANSNLVSAQQLRLTRDSQMAALGAYLTRFPDTNVYWLDHFALRTGRQIDGIEVYDLGAAPGLTY